MIYFSSFIMSAIVISVLVLTEFNDVCRLSSDNNFGFSIFGYLSDRTETLVILIKSSEKNLYIKNPNLSSNYISYISFTMSFYSYIIVFFVHRIIYKTQM